LSSLSVCIADNNAAFEWPPDEFDDEEGDMYEVPPCERQPVKVPQTQVQENIYLERTSRPEVYPPPRPSKLSAPQNTGKSPEIDRNDKPGRRKIPDPPARHVPAPVPVPEEDVYLDPNVEEEDTDDVYLEPEASCPPAPTRGLPSAKPPPPKPMAKPPVPRAVTQPTFSAIHELKTTEDRRASFPGQTTLRTQASNPCLPPDMKEHKPMPSISPMGDYKPGGGGRMSKLSGNEDKEWFAGDCSRQIAEGLLKRVRKDGAFLIRYSSDKRPHQPYTLAVLYQQKVYNIPIRFLEDSRGYALGKEGKKNEEVFSSLDEMISYHKNNQILLIDSKSQAKHTANLTQPVRY
ncbi:SH2 domain-containing protein 6, partial [Fundulus diaphanus]